MVGLEAQPATLLPRLAAAKIVSVLKASGLVSNSGAWLEWSPFPLLTEVLHRGEKLNVQHLNPLNGSQSLWEGLEVPKGSFQAIFSYRGIEYCPEPATVLAWFHTLLAPDGILVLQFIDCERWWIRMLRWMNLVRGQSGQSYCFSLRHVRTILHQNGFVVWETCGFSKESVLNLGLRSAKFGIRGQIQAMLTGVCCPTITTVRARPRRHWRL